MRRSVSALLLFLVGVLTVSASGQPQPQEGVPSPTLMNATVRLMMSGDTKRKERYDGIFQELKAKKGITVEISLSTMTEMTTRLAVEIAAGTAPDVSWLGDSNLAIYIASKNLEDISPIMNSPEVNFSDILPSLLPYCTDGGKLYAMPFTTGTRVIFFNKDLFKAKNLPDPLTLHKQGMWTWDTAFDLAKQLTDKSTGTYGIAFFNYTDPKDWKVLLEFLWSQGADFFNEGMTKVLINSSQGIKALQRYSDLIFKDSCHIKPGDQVMFESGQIAMCRNNYSYIGNLKNVNFDWDIAPFPKGPVKDAPVATGIAVYTVLKGCKYKEAAMEVIKFITDYERAKGLMDVFLPARKSLLESEAFLHASAQKPTPEGRQAAAIDSMANVRLFPSHKNFAAIDNKMKELVDLLYTRSTPIETIVRRMEDEISPLLK